MASWLVRSSPDRAVRFRALAGDNFFFIIALKLIYLLNLLRVLKHIRLRSKCPIGFCRVLVAPGDPTSKRVGNVVPDVVVWPCLTGWCFT